MRSVLSSGPIRLLFALSLALAFASAASARTEAAPPRLFLQLSLSRTQIAFAHAGDIWLVSRDGGAASQLTSGPEDDSYPSFSPDGTRMAFSRAVGDDADVYVVPVSGGPPARLSFPPAAAGGKTGHSGKPKSPAFSGKAKEHDRMHKRKVMV